MKSFLITSCVQCVVELSCWNIGKCQAANRLGNVRQSFLSDVEEAEVSL